LTRLEEILRRARERLEAKEEAKRRLEELTRGARVRAKQSILLLHRGERGAAEEKLKEARGLLEEVGGLLREYPEFSAHGGVAAAWEEYAEARILKALGEEGDFPLPLEVPLESYLLALGDVVGELRRGVLDDLREGNFEGAEERLRRMEEIYDALVSTEEASLLLKGMRRKIDVARGVIEATRGDLALEAGRRRLARTIQELMERMGREGHGEVQG